LEGDYGDDMARDCASGIDRLRNLKGRAGRNTLKKSPLLRNIGEYPDAVFRYITQDAASTQNDLIVNIKFR